ncbi:MAG: hypothetical protein HZA28_07375 [Candidatus Omnitrophica bacterium]|nr:hypothetical protein [Candidatus Omnitrophota bacterium]
MKRKIIGVTMFALLSVNVSACMITQYLTRPVPQVSLADMDYAQMVLMMEEARVYF